MDRGVTGLVVSGQIRQHRVDGWRQIPAIPRERCRAGKDVGLTGCESRFTPERFLGNYVVITHRMEGLQ